MKSKEVFYYLACQRVMKERGWAGGECKNQSLS
jgi:hypothetical protein